jgi:hypothetical protein
MELLDKYTSSGSLPQNLHRALQAGDAIISEGSSERKSPLLIDEGYGARLGLLFMALKPLRKLIRIETISRELWHLETEEAYYWYSKCSNSEQARRAMRSLRILMAEE